LIFRLALYQADYFIAHGFPARFAKMDAHFVGGLSNPLG